jgi:hypothetical protein
VKRIAFVTSADELPKGTCGLLYCNEVFEHFSPAEIEVSGGRICPGTSGTGVSIIARSGNG